MKNETKRVMLAFGVLTAFLWVLVAITQGVLVATVGVLAGILIGAAAAWVNFVFSCFADKENKQ